MQPGKRKLTHQSKAKAQMIQKPTKTNCEFCFLPSFGYGNLVTRIINKKIKKKKYQINLCMGKGNTVFK